MNINVGREETTIAGTTLEERTFLEHLSVRLRQEEHKVYWRVRTATEEQPSYEVRYDNKHTATVLEALSTYLRGLQ